VWVPSLKFCLPVNASTSNRVLVGNTINSTTFRTMMNAVGTLIGNSSRDAGVRNEGWMTPRPLRLIWDSGHQRVLVDQYPPTR